MKNLFLTILCATLLSSCGAFNSTTREDQIGSVSFQMNKSSFLKDNKVKASIEMETKN